MIFRFDTIDSTNKQIKKMLRYKKIKDSDIVVAKTQTAGRGRGNRTWIDNPGKSLLFSMMFDAKSRHITAENISLIPLSAAVAVVNAIQKHVGITLETKWPNDLLKNDKKVCGILSESIFEGEKAKSIIVGVGLNVNQIQTDFSNDLSHIATSLHMIDKKKRDTEQFIEPILKEMNKLVRPVNAGKIVQSWRQFCLHQDSEIQFHDGQKIISGIFRDINLSGAAILQTQNGNLSFYDGEIMKYKRRVRR